MPSLSPTLQQNKVNIYLNWKNDEKFKEMLEDAAF
jgi:hypothetical protein